MATRVRLHQRGGRVAARHLVHDRTLAHKMAVLRWVTDLAREAGAVDPGRARALATLLLDGGLASGSVDARPDAPAVAKASARALWPWPPATPPEQR